MKLVETSSGHLYIGSKDDVLTLLEQPQKVRFEVIWNLAEELNFLVEEEQPYSIITMIGGIPDFGIPEVNKFKFQLEGVAAILRNGGTVFVHCLGGCGRTGMALAAIKMTVDGMTADEALAFAKTECGGPETDEQEKFIRSI